MDDQNEVTADDLDYEGLPAAPTIRELAAAVLFCNEYYGQGDSHKSFVIERADSVPEVRTLLQAWIPNVETGAVIIDLVAAVPGMTREAIREALSIPLSTEPTYFVVK